MPTNKNLAQIYAANPVTTVGDTDLFYIDVAGTTDAAITGASLKTAFAGSSPWTAGSRTGSAYGGGATDGGAEYTLAWGNGSVASATGAYALGGDNGATCASTEAYAIGDASSVGTNCLGSYAIGFSSTVSNGANSSFALGTSAEVLASASGSYALGYGATVAHQGSFVFTDSANGGVTRDSSMYQFVQAFSNGFYLYGTSFYSLAWSIDASNNEINYAGQADQSSSYQSPSDSFTINPNTNVRTLIIAPGLTLTNGTIQLGSYIDGQVFRVASGSNIAALTLTSSNGDTFNTPPTSILAGQGFDLIYSLANTSWTPLYQSSSGGGGSSPWTAGSGTGSAYGGGATDGGLNYSLAWGLGSESEGVGAYAFGGDSAAGALSDYSYAFGNGAVVGTGSTGSYALGQGATVSNGAIGSFALGSSTSANNSGSFVIGSAHSDEEPEQFVASFTAGFYLYSGLTSGSFIVDGNNNILGGDGSSSASTGSYNFVYGQSFNEVLNTTSGSFVWGVTNTSLAGDNVIFGSGLTASNAGSFVINDSLTVNNDTNSQQYVASFAGGFYQYTSNGIATSIDQNSNAINHAGTADQSYSLQVPTTGFNITIANNSKTLILNPAATLLTGTVVMPASPVDGQEIRICSDQTITTLTVSPNSGQSMATPFSSTLSIGTGIGFIYNLSGTSWYRIY